MVGLNHEITESEGYVVVARSGSGLGNAIVVAWVMVVAMIVAMVVAWVVVVVVVVAMVVAWIVVVAMVMA